MGQPAAEPSRGSRWEETIRSVVVRRGREAMAPGAPLQLTLPPDARQVGVTPRAGAGLTHARTDYAQPMSEHKSRLRASISRWANQDRDEARELRKDTRKAGLVRDQGRPRP